MLRQAAKELKRARRPTFLVGRVPAYATGNVAGGFCECCHVVTEEVSLAVQVAPALLALRHCCNEVAKT